MASSAVLCFFYTPQQVAFTRQGAAEWVADCAPTVNTELKNFNFIVLQLGPKCSKSPPALSRGPFAGSRLLLGEIERSVSTQIMFTSSPCIDFNLQREQK